jgi:hypothetical protein
MRKKKTSRRLRDKRWHKLRTARRIGLTGRHFPPKLARTILGHMLRLDGKKCAICGRRGKVEDHDHKRMRHRGKLCHQCNVVLGLMQDSPQRLRKAAEYLERYEAYIQDSDTRTEWPGAVNFETEADHVLESMYKYFPTAERVRLSRWLERNWDKI